MLLGYNMAKDQWAAEKIIKKKVKELIPYDRNPKIHPDTQIDQLANSIREWGWTQPILIDENDQVLAGHGRLYAAEQLELDEVPCVIASGWSDSKKKAYVIVDNRLAEKGQWDNALLYSELKSIVDDNFDLSVVSMENEFDFMDYQPNLEPSFDYKEIDEKALIKAGEGMMGSIDSIKNDKSNEGLEVMCPYCAETFKVTGV